MKMGDDLKYMSLAIALAGKADGRTYPNPMVGAVIIKGGEVIGRGYHRRAGEDHAEVVAIKGSKGSCCGATMYVTLEPCDHYGRTPPCTETVIASGIKKVVTAMKDPNPLNKGRGIKRLKRAGIEVKTGVLEKEARDLNRKYIKFITENRPYVTLKLAQSIDGRIAARDGSSKWMSSPESRKLVRGIRKRCGGILVGANTAAEDNPFLLDEDKKGIKAYRIVVDSRLRISTRSNLIRTSHKAPVIIATTDASPEKKRTRMNAMDNVEVLVLRRKKGKVSLRGLLHKLAAKGVVDLFVEGGGEIAGDLFRQSLVDEVLFFFSPKVVGGDRISVKWEGVENISDAIKLKDPEMSRSGEDILVRGRICSRV